jgi:hypothetical protein
MIEAFMCRHLVLLLSALFACANKQSPSDSSWHTLPADVSTDLLAYAAPQSIGLGENVAIRVSAAKGPVTLDLYRVGWYGGVGARRIVSFPAAPASVLPCNTDLASGLVTCDWPDTFTIRTDSTWTSGAYLAKLTDAAKKSSYAVFVLRDDKRGAAILAKLATTTYQAYNSFGGASLYGTATPTYAPDSSFQYAPGSPLTHAVKVSFDRPYAQGAGAGYLFQWDAIMIRFLERNGYDVSYATNVDIDQTPDILTGHKMLVSMGHDEYWSKNERDRIEAAVNTNGLNFGVFSGNVGYWHIRLEASAKGDAARTQVCYRYVDSVHGSPPDPLYQAGGDNSDVTVRWRDPANGRPENALLGEMYSVVQPIVTPQFVTNPDHWALAGTGLQAGDPLPALLGWETDVRTPNSACAGCPPPPGASDSFAQSAILDNYSMTQLIPADMQLYQPSPDGGTVFDGESYGWVWQLGDTPLANPATQKITANVLDRLGSPAATPQPPQDPPDAGIGVAACAEPTWQSSVALQLDGSSGAYPMAVGYDSTLGLLVSDPTHNRVYLSSGEPGAASTAVKTPWSVYSIAAAEGKWYLAGGAVVATMDPTTHAIARLALTTAGGTPLFSNQPLTSMAYSNAMGRRLYFGTLTPDVWAIDLDTLEAARFNSDGLVAENSILTASDGTLLVLSGNSRPARLIRLDPRGGGDLDAGTIIQLPPASVVFDSTHDPGDPLRFGWGESGALVPFAAARLDDGDLAVSRIGRGDVALLRGAGTGSPQLCPIAGTGRRGTSVGAVTDIPLPTGLAAGTGRSIYVADPLNARVLRLAP